MAVLETWFPITELLPLQLPVSMFLVGCSNVVVEKELVIENSYIGTELESDLELVSSGTEQSCSNLDELEFSIEV